MSVILRILELIFTFFYKKTEHAAKEGNKAVDAEPVPDDIQSRFRDRVRRTTDPGE